MTTNFIRGANPIWFMANLTGQPLDDRYWAFFLNNVFPYAMDDDHRVWQDPAHTTPWSNPIEFQPSSGLPNNIYFDPSQTWRIEIRKGNTQADQLIYAINNYMPGSGTSSVIENPLQFAQNLITNPQFADIYFTSPFTYTQTNPAEYIVPVGPGWDLVLTGAGTTILTQHAIDGASASPGNPPYSLEINNSLWTSAVLRQRLSNNGAIFAGGAVGVSFDGNAVISQETVSITYKTSFNAEVLLITKSLPTGGLIAYKNAEDIPASSSSNVPPAAWVDININLPAGRVVLTNIQVTGQSTQLSEGFTDNDAPSFQELTYEQVVNAEFHVYKNSIVINPKQNILVGWNFALNPYQFVDKAIAVVVPITSYIADQTIFRQESGSALVTGQELGPSAGLFIQGIVAKPDNRFAIIQYIDGASIKPYWGNILSCLVRAMYNGDNASTVRIKARLIYRTDLPPALANDEPITGWDANGDVTFKSGWTALTPTDDPNYLLGKIFDTDQGVAVSPAYQFNGFNLPVSPDPTTNLPTVGLVIYTTETSSVAGTPNGVLIDKVSLVPIEFGIDANPETFDECLRKCQFYYEYSYPPGSFPLPGTPIVEGSTSVRGLSGSPEIAGFDRPFKSTKRVTPTIQWFSPNDNAEGYIFIKGGINVQVDSTYATSVSSTGYPILSVNPLGDFLYLGQWVADVRLGI